MILDKLMEKKSLIIYCDQRIKQLQRSTLNPDVTLRHRDNLIKRARINELRRLKGIIGHLKKQSEAIWLENFKREHK